MALKKYTNPNYLAAVEQVDSEYGLNTEAYSVLLSRPFKVAVGDLEGLYNLTYDIGVETETEKYKGLIEETMQRSEFSGKFTLYL